MKRYMTAGQKQVRGAELQLEMDPSRLGGSGKEFSQPAARLLGALRRQDGSKRKSSAPKSYLVPEMH